MTNSELITKLNDLKIHQTSGDWQEDIPEDIYDEYFENAGAVASGLEVDTHRWYELSTSVVSVNGSFIGINAISNTFSESMGYDDVYHHLEFFEMKEVKVVSYVKA